MPHPRRNSFVASPAPNKENERQKSLASAHTHEIALSKSELRRRQLEEYLAAKKSRRSAINSRSKFLVESKHTPRYALKVEPILLQQPKHTIDTSRSITLKCFDLTGNQKRLVNTEVIPRSAMNLFRLSRIQRAMDLDELDLAHIMMLTVCAPHQPERMSNAYAKRLVQLDEDLTKAWHHQSRKSTLTSSMLSSSSSISLPEPPELHSISQQLLDGDFSGSAEDLKMQQEIDLIVAHSPALRQRSNPLVDSIAQAIREASPLNTPTAKRIKQECTRTPRNSPQKDLGSVFGYAVVTPNQRTKELLGCESAISPMRRSLRFLNKGNDQFYESLGHVKDLASHGFLPNKTINTDHISDQRKPAKGTKQINMKREQQ